MTKSPIERARTLLGWGAGVTLAGIVLCVTGTAQVGSWVVVGGLLLLLFGLHTYGRTGPDELVAAPVPKRRKVKPPADA